MELYLDSSALCHKLWPDLKYSKHSLHEAITQVCCFPFRHQCRQLFRALGSFHLNCPLSPTWCYRVPNFYSGKSANQHPLKSQISSSTTCHGFTTSHRAFTTRQDVNKSLGCSKRITKLYTARTALSCYITSLLRTPHICLIFMPISANVQGHSYTGRHKEPTYQEGLPVFLNSCCLYTTAGLILCAA